jgi:NAD(P)H dehydrogenase (quinone)
MTIAITGASGPLGRATADFVLQAVDPRQVVLTTRRPEALADLAARGADVRRADFTDPRTLATAFAGVDRLLLIPTDAMGARLGAHRAAVSAAAGAGVRHVIYTSVPEPVPANPALVVADHAGTEQALRDSGLRWTMLRNNLYTHMQTPGIAQAAASVLTQDGHEDQAYDVTGPEALSADDLVALAREIGGRDVELVSVDDAAFMAGLRSAGLPDEVAQLVTSFGAATRGGFLAHVSSTVADLTGRTPLLLGLGVYTAAGLLCAAAPNVGVLILFRGLQGVGGAFALVIAYACVRDRYAGKAAARYFSLLLLVSGLAPVLSPLAGAQILRLSGWRAIFVALAVLSCVVLIVCVRALPESLPPRRLPAGRAACGQPAPCTPAC